MLDSPLTYFVFGLLFAWVASYFYSAWHNRRKLTWLAKWLEPALPILGTGVSSRFQGTDRLDILVGEGRGIMRDGAIVIGVQSRRLFNALLSTLRGGKDSLSILISLTRVPGAASHFEIFSQKDPLPRSVALAADSWIIEDYPRAPYRVAFKDKVGQESAFRLIALLYDMQLDIRRISVRPNVPHLFITLNMVHLPQVEAGELLRVIRSLAEEAVETSDNITRPGRPSNKPKDRNRDKFKQFPPQLTQPTTDPKLSRNGHHKNDE